MKNKTIKYRELYAQGWNMNRIAAAFGVTRQAVHSGLNTQYRIPSLLKYQAALRDNGKCSHCAALTHDCSVVDRSKEVTLDNIGLLCGSCSRARTYALKRALLPHKPCKLTGCDAPCSLRPLSRYCSREHYLRSVEIRKAATRAKHAAVTERKCRKCLLVKPVAEFYPVYDTSRYPSSRCKKCASIATRAAIKKILADKSSPKYAALRARSDVSTKKYHAKLLSTPEGRAKLKAASARQWQRSKERTARLREEKLKAQQEKLNSPEVRAVLDKLKKIL